MVIRFCINILFIVTLLSCKDTVAKKINNKSENSQVNEILEFVNYNERKSENGINIFYYENTLITIDYDKHTILGLKNNEELNLYEIIDLDLDLGELNLLKFRKNSTVLYLIELDNFTQRDYKVILYYNNILYNLGEFSYSFIEQKVTENTNLKFEVEINNNNLFISEINKTGNLFESYEFINSEKLNVKKSYKDYYNYLIEKDENKIPNSAGSIGDPEYVAKYIIFTKDANGILQINKEYLKYIQQNTSAKQNQYVLALEKYVTHEIIKYFNNESTWTEEELIKIIAYASNTTDPLFKKLWTKSPENWNYGMWGNILGFCYLVYNDRLWMKMLNQFEQENYYNLPHLKEMVHYAEQFDKFGPPDLIEN